MLDDGDRLLSPQEWLVWRGRERWPVATNHRGPGLPAVSEGPAAAVKAAWLPVRTGQAVPLLGEDVPWEVCAHGVDDCDCR